MTINLTDEERQVLLRLINDALATSRFPLSPELHAHRWHPVASRRGQGETATALMQASERGSIIEHAQQLSPKRSEMGLFATTAGSRAAKVYEVDERQLNLIGSNAQFLSEDVTRCR